jgi:glucose/arabinose dehydrogenase
MFGPAQTLEDASGCVLRIFKNGSVPADNIGRQRPTWEPACWSYGVRNGYSTVWDLQPVGKERYFIAEVGGNSRANSWEDLHLGRPGQNYGWPLCEGPCLNRNFPTCSCALHDAPLYTYPHAGGPACIIGGLVYRGTRYPSKYVGTFWFADFALGWMKYLTFDEDGGQNVTGVYTLADDESVAKIIALNGDDEFNVWIVRSTGQVSKLVYIDPNNKRPTITQATVRRHGRQARTRSGENAGKHQLQSFL